MARRTETEVLADITAVETAISELVSSGVVGFNAGAGGPAVSGAAMTVLIDRKKELREELNALPSGAFSTLEYDVDEHGTDQTEYQDG